MRYLYRVKRVNGSSQDYDESDNQNALQDAQADFVANGVSITKIRLYYTLANDPENRQFDQSDEADAARLLLVAPLQASVDVAYEKIPHYEVVEAL